mmetsp:Transcript_41825/g.35147  ORF Transcript_41825/g.35147 Transcript_41825/m.35147 type:complete len:382 (+) Transcript_41825:1-1146(+)
MNISAAWGWPDDMEQGLWYGNEKYGNYNLTLYAYEDPGVPNGAVLTTQSCLGYPQQIWDTNIVSPLLRNPHGTVICNPVRRTFTWEPRKEQEGLVHSVCFTALVRERPSDCQAEYRCIDFDVKAPDIQWQRSITPAHMHKFHSPVGCHFTQCFESYDAAALYPVDVKGVATSFPAGAVLAAECQEMPASIQVYSLFPSDTAAPFARAQGACRKCLDFVAVRGMETQVYTICVAGTDRSPKPENAALRSSETCVVVEVPKCKYCVQTGDTLHYINKRYHLNSNWLQLWNANGIEEIVPHPLSVATTYNDPDAIHNGNSIINLGPIYEVQAGEDMISVAKMLRTTVKKLLDINPDIKDPTSVLAGTMVCAQPCTDIYFASASV